MRATCVRTGLLVRRGLLLAAGWMTLGVSGLAQDSAAGAKTPAYEVVSVKPNKLGSNNVRINSSSGRYMATNVSLKMLLQSAYDLKMQDQISGSLGSLADARFDIEAKMDEETVEAQKKLPAKEASEQRQRMMQALLADRFQLKLHHETKELPMYALVVAKGGSKLKQADPNDTYANGIKGPDGISRGGMMMTGRGTLTAQAVEMESLARQIGQMLGRIVQDKTGLTGKFDMQLKWTPDDLRSAAGADNGAAADTGPTIYTALQEQMGLKLESTKGSVDTIVVDHVEIPSEN
jgi:uncharacterized protein (TIGR03435 family)